MPVILQRLECKIYFAKFSFQIYFAKNWRSVFHCIIHFVALGAIKFSHSIHFKRANTQGQPLQRRAVGMQLTSRQEAIDDWWLMIADWQTGLRKINFALQSGLRKINFALQSGRCKINWVWKSHLRENKLGLKIGPMQNKLGLKIALKQNKLVRIDEKLTFPISSWRINNGV